MSVLDTHASYMPSNMVCEKKKRKKKGMPNVNVIVFGGSNPRQVCLHIPLC